jgi:AbrB family looped-hinge helix DNA binding protein
MLYKTKISNGFQTVVPSEIRKKFDITPGDHLEWVLTDDEVILRFRKKVTLEDIFGMVDGPETDAVELKKKVQRGEKIDIH